MWTAWEFDPTVVAGIAALGLIYALCGGAWRARFPDSRPLTRAQLKSFGAGLIVFWLFLQSPIDRVGDDFLFSLHMLQHMVIILVVPVLILRGIPSWMVQPLMGGRAAPLVRLGCRPLVAFTLFNMIFAVAHIPVFFDPVNSDETLHAIEHLVFLSTAVIMWIPILSPLLELRIGSYPMQIGYLFLQTLPMSIVAAFITLSSDPWYQRYSLAPRITALSTLQDQQIGGLLMWIGGSLYFFGAMAVLFFLWAQQEEQTATGAAPSHSSA